MPLYLNEVAIEYLNGPVCMSILKPKRSNLQIQNNFILFGDTHNNRRFQACNENDKSCVELETSFIAQLNEYAKKHPVYFYFEAYMDHSFYEKLQDENYNPKPERKVGNSNMINTIHRYKTCFYMKDTNVNKKLVCPYSNIKWQYADIRHTGDTAIAYRNKHDKPHVRNGKYDIEYLLDKSSYFEYFNGIIGEFFTESVNFNNFVLSMDDEVFQEVNANSGNDLMDYMQMTDFFYLLLTDTPLYITTLLDSYSYRKQLDMLSADMREILSTESFIQYAEYNIHEELHNYSKKNYEPIIKDKKIEDSCRSFLSSIILAISRKDIPLLKSLRESDYKSALGVTSVMLNEYILSILESQYSSSVDIYFVLRSYSSKHAVLRGSRLTLGYFGVYHIDAIKHYLTNIVKTHREIFQSDNRDGGGIRRIHIDKSVYLNQKVLPLSKSKTSRSRSRSRSRPFGHSNKSKSKSVKKSKTKTKYNTY